MLRSLRTTGRVATLTVNPTIETSAVTEHVVDDRKLRSRGREETEKLFQRLQHSR